MAVRAIVVGAGFAGLAAADALARAGASVVVLEARNRVGGRVWSRELPNGALVEMGAEFVLPGNSVLVGLVERFRLGFWAKGMRYGDREPRGVPGVDRASLLAAAREVEAALLRSPDGSPPESARDFLDGLGLDPGVREAILARVEVSCASTADLLDARVLAGLAAQASDECPSVAGGNQRVAVALARGLGTAVHLSSPVDRIVWNGAGVRVRGGGAEVAGDVAVVAVPGSALRRIVFDPPLPADVERSFAALVYGHAAKLFVPLLAPAPPSAVLSVPERYWTWTAAGAGAAVQRVLHAFAGSEPALRALDVSAGAGRWLASIERLRTDLALDHSGAVLSTWSDDPWAGGAYSTPTPGRTDDALTRGVGPIVFCGEHTAGPDAALMEGALRSGLRAAADVLRREAG